MRVIVRFIGFSAGSQHLRLLVGNSTRSPLAQVVSLNNLARVVGAVGALGHGAGAVNLDSVALAREQELNVTVLLLNLSISKLLALLLNLGRVGLRGEHLGDGAVRIETVVGNEATEAAHNGEPLHIV